MLKNKQNPAKSNLKGDYGNIAILLFLYLLQGIPLGLIYAVPMILQKRGLSYKDQAGLSFSQWPYAMKILWAPIVDAMYIKRFGRRKSWLIPTQLFIGIFMLLLSPNIEKLLGDESHNEPNIAVIASVFFVLCFFAATQDIIVDGWALTMLKRQNIGHAATCNSVGLLCGYFIAFSGFIALESRKIVNFSQFLFFWGVIFVISTVLVALFKKEAKSSTETELKYGVIESYSILKSIVIKKPLILLASIFLTMHIMFSASNAITTLKLIDRGVPRESLALIAVIPFPLEVLLPFFIGKYTTGPRPLDIFNKINPPSLMLTVLLAGFVWATPILIQNNLNNIPTYYYVMYTILHGSYQLLRQCGFVAAMAFFARISDQRFGGTYMTLLNTISNFGYKWSATLMLWLVEFITWKSCVVDTSFSNANTCSNKDQVESCKQLGGSCRMDIDGYYIECTLCIIYGILWYFWGKKKIKAVQNIPLESWQVNYKKTFYD
ncbi:unnamed protein product [Diamesa serratosioi]